LWVKEGFNSRLFAWVHGQILTLYLNI
jgi:hypothetical protein